MFVLLGWVFGAVGASPASAQEPTIARSASAATGDTLGAGPSPVEVTVAGLRSGEGAVRIALFDSEDGFTERPLRWVVVEAVHPNVTWFTHLAPGTYALAVIHDRNGNERLDTGLFGIPREPYGFSNGARGLFGPPSFADAAFRVGATPLHVQVEVR